MPINIKQCSPKNLQTWGRGCQNSGKIADIVYGCSLTKHQGKTVFEPPASLLPNVTVDLYLNFEKSSWKNQVPRTGFLVYSKLDFYYLCS